MKKSLSYIWALPFNLIGFIMHKVYKKKGWQTFKYKDATVTVYGFGSGVSLGNYIFIPLWAMLDIEEKENYIKHEYGHTLQARRLGVGYLIVFFCSMLWNVYSRLCTVDYYSFWTEKWADKLGGVRRK